MASHQNCDLCVSGTKTKKIIGYCKDCNGYLCEICFQTHTKAKAFRQHSIDQGATAKQSDKEVVSLGKLDLHEQICRRHKNEKTSLFCRKHLAVICGRCLVQKHMICEDQVVDLMEVSNQSTDHLNEILQGLENVLNDTKCIEKDKNQKSTLYVTIKNFEPDIDTLKQTLNEASRKLLGPLYEFLKSDVINNLVSTENNKCIPLRSDNNHKTIDQIHNEVAQEKQEKALQSQHFQFQQKSQPRGGRRGPPSGQMGGDRGGQGNDGWNTVGNRTPLRSVDCSIDPSRMNISKFGPGGGTGRFANWGRGSIGGTSGRGSMEKEKPSTPANRLSKPEYDSGRRMMGSSPSWGEGRGRGGFGRPPNPYARLLQEQEREKAVAAAKAIGAGQQPEDAVRESRGRGRGSEPRVSAEPVVALASSTAAVLSDDKMEKKTKAILDEYFQILDSNEATLCVKELSPENHHHFIYHAINHVLERSPQARNKTGHLLHDLVNKNVISVDNYIKGLVEVLDFAEYLEIDIPKIWQFHGELISPMIQDGSMPLSILKNAVKPHIANNKVGVLLAEVLHDASHREGHKKIAGLWKASGLTWSEFVPGNQIDQFLADKGLEYTKGGDRAPTTPTTGLPLTEIADRLHDLIIT
ncbi:IF4G1-like protein [Mya arenaria]|uniref:IF4G1-like protein n=1 Tax=Mya arenaria TaxID=6604 RepID=A0ABY7EXZ3_MYAAR|nr:IF4G1-like protein [Mya arenaria]